MLGPVKGKRVLEIGAGMGRFTGDLGAQAKTVLAVDFMERLIEENERQHGHMGNITFKSGDACELQAEPASFDIVFTNWLLMYLGKASLPKRPPVLLHPNFHNVFMLLQVMTRWQNSCITC